jgi:putative endonuclease
MDVIAACQRLGESKPKSCRHSAARARQSRQRQGGIAYQRRRHPSGPIVCHSGARAQRASPESITPVFEMAYYLYLLASRKHGTLHLGVTKDIVRRGYEHRTKAIDGFTTRYGVDKLVWFEIYDDVATAIAREKELKKWRRDWKIRLIEEENPGWVDLYPGISS